MLGMQQIANKALKLENFPPRLRRIAEIMINSIEFYSLKKVCELADVNYDSAKTMIARYRKRGIDFNEFVSSKVVELLRKGKYDVYKSLREGVINGSAAHLKLFAQLTGDLVEKQQIQHEHKIYIATPTGNVIPADILRQHKKDEEALKEKQDKAIEVTTIK